MRRRAFGLIFILFVLLGRADQMQASGLKTMLKGDAFTVDDVQNFKSAANEFAKAYTNSFLNNDRETKKEKDRRYLVNYSASYKLGEQLKFEQFGGSKLMITSDSSFDYSSSPFLTNDSVYLKNQLTLVKGSERVLGGQVDVIHPDCVAVGSKYGIIGSGTLIAPRLVVTAGHCYTPGFTDRVVVGVDYNDPNNQIYMVKSAFVAPQYDPGTHSNDLCLLVLTTDVTNVIPRKIATSAQIYNSVGGYISGFGNTNYNSTAGAGLRRWAGPIGFADAKNPVHGAFSNLELVLGPNPQGQDTCSGDSGGPLYIWLDQKYYLAGATSRATYDSVSICGDGGIYVRLDVFYEWIKSIAQMNGLTLN